MTRFLLIRHGLNDAVGKTIVSWTPGVHLNAEGREQAERLPALLEGIPIDAIYSSPLERAQETAAPVATRRNLPIQTRDAFGEVRFGDFSGQALTDLEQDPEWQKYRAFRSANRASGGELALEVQARFVSELNCLRAQHPDQTVAVFSHADSIKAALAVFLGVSLDLFDRIVVYPASVSVVDLDDWGAKVHRINWTGSLLSPRRA
jgi:probable phosphoglycerate mutase